MDTKPAVATRLRGIWMGVTDMNRSREFYTELGAHFDESQSPEGIVHATLGGARLVFETVPVEWGKRDGGPYLLFDVTDADALYRELAARGREVVKPPENEPWGRQFNVIDPDGHSLAFIGPSR